MGLRPRILVLGCLVWTRDTFLVFSSESGLLFTWPGVTQLKVEVLGLLGDSEGGWVFTPHAWVCGCLDTSFGGNLRLGPRGVKALNSRSGVGGLPAPRCFQVWAPPVGRQGESPFRG